MTRVCLYMRISTDKDHQPTSLTTQRERLERYCEAMEDWHDLSFLNAFKKADSYGPFSLTDCGFCAPSG